MKLPNKSAQFRFYEELNDFLPRERKKTWFTYAFEGRPAIKDTVEALGVPHTEIDLILVNGESVDFSYHLQDGDRVSVYPVFESLDISGVTRLRAKPLRKPKFILDVHLGKLARYMRMLGFDTLYDNSYRDEEIVRLASAQKRAILTRDVGILKNGAVTHGYWIRSKKPLKQVAEVLERFDLYSSIRPFYRCMVCNGEIEKIDRESIGDKIPAETGKYYDEFYQCRDCRRIYWKGYHYEKMKAIADGKQITG